MFEQRGPHPSEQIDRRPPISQVAAAYLGYVLEGDRAGAVRLLVAQVEQGADALVLLRDVVEAAEQEFASAPRRDTLTAEQRSVGAAAAAMSRALLQPPVFTDVPT